MFDIDGTLMRTRAGRRALRHAFSRLFDVQQIDAGIALGGKTDLQIFRELAARLPGVQLDPTEVAQEYLAALRVEIAADRGELCPGFPGLLEALSKERESYLALGTGNLEAGARMKLAAHDLNRFFPVGGFGSDAEDRSELIAAGVARARTHYGCSFTQVLVIGDTPLDIACGRVNCATTVAVATGNHSAAELAACGADLVLQSMGPEQETLSKLRLLMPKS